MKLFDKTINIIGKNNIKNSMYSLGAKFIAMIFFLLTDIIIVRSCGKILYGEWSFNYSIITMCFWIINFGVNVSARVHVAKDRLEGKQVLTCCKTSILVRTLFTGLIFMVFLLILPILSGYIGYPEKYPHLKLLFILGALQCASYSWVEFFKDFFIGLDKIKGLFILTITEYFGYFVFGAIGLVLSKSLLVLAIGYIFAEIVCCVIGIFLIEKYTKVFTKWREIIFQKEDGIQIFKYAIPILFINIGSLVLIEMDSVMLGILFSQGENGIYSIAKSLIQKMTQVNFAISSVIMAEFAVITFKNRIVKRKRYFSIQGLNIMGSLGISVIAYFAGYYAIQLLYGSEYIESSSIFRLLLPYYVMYSMNLFSGTLLDYQKKANQRMVAYFSMILMNLILNLLLIPKLGGNGAAIATCISLVPYTVILEILVQNTFKETSYEIIN